MKHFVLAGQMWSIKMLGGVPLILEASNKAKLHLVGQAHDKKQNWEWLKPVTRFVNIWFERL